MSLKNKEHTVKMTNIIFRVLVVIHRWIPKTHFEDQIFDSLCLINILMNGREPHVSGDLQYHCCHFSFIYCHY